MDETILWDNNLEEREDYQGEMQGGATNLLNTSHATEMYSDTLKSKELGDGEETKKMTDTAPNTTNLAINAIDARRRLEKLRGTSTG